MFKKNSVNEWKNSAIYCCIFISWTRSRNILHGRYATSTMIHSRNPLSISNYRHTKESCDKTCCHNGIEQSLKLKKRTGNKKGWLGQLRLVLVLVLWCFSYIVEVSFIGWGNDLIPPTIQSTTIYPLRNGNDIIVPLCRLSLARDYFVSATVREWNNLNLSVRNLDTSCI